jgi:hypothetical protein
MKRYLIIFIILICNDLKSQSWNYSSGSNSFDGNYKSASSIGKGVDFPYQKPQLNINLFENDKSLNFYIEDSGYYPSDSNLNITWVFDKEPNIIYETELLSLSKSRKIIFFNTFKESKSNVQLSKLDFFEKLKKSNRIDLRISDKYGVNDFVFSLQGFSKIIDKIITNEYKNWVEEKAKLESENNKKLLLEKSIIIDEISKIFRDLEMSNIEREKIVGKLIVDSELHKKFNLFDFDSLTINLKNKFIQTSFLNILNNEKNTVYSIHNLNLIIPEYIKKLEERRNLDIYNKVLSFLVNFNLTDEENHKILDKINEVESYSFESSDILKVEIEINPEYEIITKLNIVDKYEKVRHVLIIVNRDITAKLSR